MEIDRNWVDDCIFILILIKSTLVVTSFVWRCINLDCSKPCKRFVLGIR
jgi:hypothetical protein